MVPHYPHGHCFEQHERTLGPPDNASMMPLFSPICCWRENYQKNIYLFLCKNYTLVWAASYTKDHDLGKLEFTLIEDAAIHVTVFIGFLFSIFQCKNSTSIVTHFYYEENDLNKKIYLSCRWLYQSYSFLIKWFFRKKILKIFKKKMSV